MQETDAALVERFIAHQDIQAYTAIVTQYTDFVYAICYRVLHDSGRAEDAVQETFLQLLRKPDSVNGSLSAWLHTTATWKAIDLLRRESARRQRERESEPQASVETSRWEEISPHVDQALAEISQPAQDLLIHHFLKRKSQAELAEELGVSQPTVSRRIESALEQLRDSLRQQGILVTLTILTTFLSHRTVEAAPQELIKTLAKLTDGTATVAGGDLLIRATVWRVAGRIAAAFVFVASIVAILFLSSFHSPLLRPWVRSVHFVMQSGSSEPGSPSSISKGAYEQWFYLAGGADGPVLFRMQRWDAKQTLKMCSWLQNEDGNYYFNCVEKKVYSSNARLPLGSLRTRRLPTDGPELTAFLDRIEGRIPDLAFAYDAEMGRLVSATDRRFPEVMNFQTRYEYDTVGKDFFKYNWGKDIKIVDERDAMHKRGWTYFRVTGRIGDMPVQGQGRIPFVYAAYGTHQPWMELRVGKHLRFVDTPEGAWRQDSGRQTSTPCIRETFFKGLSRPWIGMHTIDLVRRDAAEKRVPFTTKRLEKSSKVQVALLSDGDYVQTQLTYVIDMDRDLVESIQFDDESTLTFSYLDDVTGVGHEFVKPTHPDWLQEVPARDLGISWLMDLDRLSTG